MGDLFSQCMYVCTCGPRFRNVAGRLRNVVNRLGRGHTPGYEAHMAMSAYIILSCLRTVR